MTIPSTDDVLSKSRKCVFGAGLNGATDAVNNATIKTNWYIEDDYVRCMPRSGVTVSKYAAANKVLKKAGGVVTGINGGLDVLRQKINNTNGQRVIKSVIQAGGIAATVGAGAVISAATTALTVTAVNFWNPLGWVAAAVGVVAFGVAAWGISEGQEALYNALDIE